jgi:Resolvase, N terminal domain
MRYRITRRPAPRFSRQARWAPPFSLLGVCNLVPCGQGVDTTTPAGKALFRTMGVFAEFERAMTRERVCAGLD